MILSPICIFAYKRINHLKRLIESLEQNPESKLSDVYIFIDGPKNDQDIAQVDAVLNYAQKINIFKSLTVFNSAKNKGLANSIIDGVTYTLSKHQTVIVLEDDLFLSPYFLRYMNSALNLYENNERVASIHGYVYPSEEELDETFFMRGADCWGWGTWQRAWKHFNPDGQHLANALKKMKLVKRFNFDGAYPYYQMLLDQVSGKNNSWAIRWHASAYIKNMLTLYPGKSLVQNIGFDDTGENCKSTQDFSTDFSLSPIELFAIPLVENEIAYQAFKKNFLKNKISLTRRLFNKIKKMMDKFYV